VTARLRTHRLVAVSAAFLVVSVIGAVVAIHAGLAYRFAGTGDPHHVARDFASGGGTALSPPLNALLFLGVLCAIALWRHRAWGYVGAAGLTAIGALFVVALAVAMVVLGLLDLRARWRDRPRARTT
jgi:small neutral amino acid transporter SnatA (MarC family)